MTTAGAAAPLPALIPRVALFGNQAQTQPQISPDGARIAYLAPTSGGRLSIWVRTAGKPGGRLIVPVGERALRKNNRENNLRFSAAAEEFLGRYLGGRVEPPAPAESVTAYLR